MIYKIHCEVCLGYSCCGQYHGEEDELAVDLTDDEAQQIREYIHPDESKHLLPLLEEILPEVYEKVSYALYDYLYFVAADDARKSGLWQDCIQSGRTIDDFVQEDIDSDVISTEDDEGNPLSETEISFRWQEYENDYINSLSHHEAYEYIINRYECEPDNVDGIQYTLTLPEELQPHASDTRHRV